MNLRFSLLGLIGFTTFAGVASAALAQPSYFWTSVAVSLTGALLSWQVLRAILCTGESRAAAVGWLVFALGYLALILGPWFSSHLGPHLLTSRGLVQAQVEWHKLPINSPDGQQIQVLDWSGRANMSGVPYYDGTGSSIWTDPGWVSYPAGSGTLSSAAMMQQFHLSGHWLCAWIAGWLGSALAVQLQRYQTSRRALA